MYNNESNSLIIEINIKTLLNQPEEKTGIQIANYINVSSKGQLISKYPFGAYKSIKKTTFF